MQAAIDSDSDDGETARAVADETLKFLRRNSTQLRCADAPDLWGTGTSSTAASTSTLPKHLPDFIRACYPEFLNPLSEQQDGEDLTSSSCLRFSGLPRDLLDAIKVVRDVRIHLIESFR
jgi:hypothetical protein